jgi:GTP-binding protein
MCLADLPGYGYAKISKSISAEWPKFIEPYLAERTTLGLCVCLVDSNVPPQPRDRQLLDWLRHVGRSFLVVATKTDRLSGNERTRNLAALRKGLELDEILPVSAKTGAGIGELWARIEETGTKGTRD